MAEDVSDKELIPKIYKGLITIQQQKNQTNSMGGKNEQMNYFFFQPIPTDSQEVHEKRFNITDAAAAAKSLQSCPTL